MSNDVTDLYIFLKHGRFVIGESIRNENRYISSSLEDLEEKLTSFLIESLHS